MKKKHFVILFHFAVSIVIITLTALIYVPLYQIYQLYQLHPRLIHTSVDSSCLAFTDLLILSMIKELNLFGLSTDKNRI